MTHEQATIGMRVRCIRPMTTPYNPTGEGTIVEVRRYVVLAQFDDEEQPQVFGANELEPAEKRAR